MTLAIEQLNAFTLSSIILLLVLGIDRLLIIPAKYHPLFFFRIFVERLSSTIHPSNKRHAHQQYISGSFGIIAAVVPFVLLIYLFVGFTEYPLFFEALILWLSLGWHACRLDLLKVSNALKHQQKNLAKDRLNQWILRKTNNLSDIGIAKTACEAMILRHLYFYQMIIICYLSLGPYAAFTLRLLLEINQIWNAKKPRFIYFGLPIRYLCHTIFWLPNRLMFFIFLLLSKPFKRFKQLKSLSSIWPYSNSLWPLGIIASLIKIKLGGPIVYENDKIRRAHLNNHKQPSHDSILKTNRLLMIQELILLLFVILTNCAILLIK